MRTGSRIAALPFVARGVGFLLLWLVLTDGRLAMVLPGILAAAVAARVSLALLPPRPVRPAPAALIRFLGRLAVSMVAGGVDVARRAFTPALPLSPGILRYRPRTPPGPARDSLRALMGLPPGALAFEAEDGDGWLVHCLDIHAPVVATLAEDEAQFRRALGSEDAA